MGSGGDEVVSEGIHFLERADAAGIAVVVCVTSASEGWAACGFDGDEAVGVFAAELLSHKGSDEATEVGAASCAPDDDIGLDAEFLEGGLGFETDNGLMEEDVIEDASEDVAEVFVLLSGLDGLGDGASEGAGGIGVSGVDGASDGGGEGWGGDDVCAIGAHDFAPEGFLFVGALDHIDVALEVKECACHGECGAPLSGAGFGGDALEALSGGIVGLSDGAIEFVGAGGIVAFELVVDFAGGADGFFEEVCSHEGGGAKHFVEVLNGLRDGDEGGGIVEFLLDAFGAEDAFEFFRGGGLTGDRVEEGCGLGGHVSADVVPSGGEFGFGEVGFVGDGGVHGVGVWLVVGLGYKNEKAPLRIEARPLPVIEN